MADGRKRCWVCTKPVIWGRSDTACSEYCRAMLHAESHRIARYKEKSHRQGRLCNLLLREWAETLRHYNWLCAFCKGPFEDLDHFVPVSRGGTSWVGNVVPVCFRCQRAKGNLLPEEIEFIPRDSMDMIARYLECRAKMATRGIL